MPSRKLDSPPPSQAFLKALAVTDNPSGIHGLSAALREAGAHRAHVVTVRPREVREALNNDTFGLVILHDSPPRCDALELLHDATEVPTLVVSEHDNDDRVLKELEAGAFDVLTRRQATEGLLPYALRRLFGPPRHIQEELQRQIEKHKEAEAALQESNRRFRLALKNSPICVWFQDEELRYAWVYNPVAAFGDTANIIGRTDEELYGPHGARSLIEIKRKALATGQKIHREIRVAMEGRIIYLNIIVEPVRNSCGQMMGIRCASMNITGARHAEEELRRTQEQLMLANLQPSQGEADPLQQHAQLLNVMPDAIIVRDMTGCIAFWNQGAERMYGWTEQEALGRMAQELMASDYAMPLDDLKSRALTEGYAATEIRQTTRDGRRIIVQSVWAVQRNAGGEPISFLQINRDITELKQSAETMRSGEAEIRRQKELLEAAVSEHLAEVRRLEQARQESEQQAAVGRMAAHIAHEINNPLAGVGMAFKLVKKAIPHDFPHYEFVGRIERELKRMERIVHQMFGLYRPEQEEPVLCNPAETIQDVVMLMDSDRRLHSATIITDVESTAQSVLLHEDCLKQALFNLLQNAIEASRDGGKIHVQAEIKDDRLALAIADDGCGIREEDQPHIFDRFFTTKSGHGRSGLGLGLSVTRSLIERIGGTIRFESQPSLGTTFHVSMPISPA